MECVLIVKKQYLKYTTLSTHLKRLSLINKTLFFKKVVQKQVYFKCMFSYTLIFFKYSRSLTNIIYLISINFTIYCVYMTFKISIIFTIISTIPGNGKYRKLSITRYLINNFLTYAIKQKFTHQQTFAFPLSPYSTNPQLFLFSHIVRPSST